MYAYCANIVPIFFLSASLSIFLCEKVFWTMLEQSGLKKSIRFVLEKKHPKIENGENFLLGVSKHSAKAEEKNVQIFYDVEFVFEKKKLRRCRHLVNRKLPSGDDFWCNWIQITTFAFHLKAANSNLYQVLFSSRFYLLSTAKCFPFVLNTNRIRLSLKIFALTLIFKLGLNW